MVDYAALSKVHHFYRDCIAGVRDERWEGRDPLFAAAAAKIRAALKAGALDQAQAALDVARTRRDEAGPALDAFAALLSAQRGDADAARAFSNASVAAAPRAPAAWQCHGALLARLGAYAEAEAALRIVVNLDPERGAAWAALALIYALAGDWAKAKPAAAAALARKVELRGGLVRLAHVCALIHLGEDASAQFSLAALHFDEAELDALVGRLPGVDGSFAIESDPSTPHLFTACDMVYLREHVPALIWSLERLGEPVALHLHLYNPTREIDALFAAFDSRRRAVNLSVTAEHIDAARFPHKTAYFAAARYVRAWQAARQWAPASRH